MLDPMHPEVDVRFAHRLLGSVVVAALVAAAALSALAVSVG